MHGSIRMGWVPQPMCYFTTLFYLTAPCGLANPQGFHGSGLDLSIQAERAVGQIIALYPTYDSETHHTRRLGILPNPKAPEGRQWKENWATTRVAPADNAQQML